MARRHFCSGIAIALWAGSVLPKDAGRTLLEGTGKTNGGKIRLQAWENAIQRAVRWLASRFAFTSNRDREVRPYRYSAGLAGIPSRCQPCLLWYVQQHLHRP